MESKPLRGMRSIVGTQSRKIRRTMFIGLGGTGDEVIRRVKQEMLDHHFDLPLFQYLVLDTVVFKEKNGIAQNQRLRNGEEYLYIGNYDPNEVLKNLENWPVISSWWGSRTRTNLVTVDEGAGQMRSVGRMGFFYHFNMIEVQLKRMVQQITNISNRESAMLDGYEISENSPIVYLVFSLCGGTGSSLFFDVAYTIRHLMKEKGIKPTIVGVAMLPGPYMQSISSIPQQERIQANSYAALMEMERLHNMALGVEPRANGKDIWSVQYTTNFRVDSPDLPFDYIYLIDDTTVKSDSIKRERIYTALGKAIFWLSGPSTASPFWERAKNLNSKTLASGGQPDASGRRRLTPYSSLGISNVLLTWRLERLQHELENLFIERIRTMPMVAKPNLPSFCSNGVNLKEHVSGEATLVNPIPPSKALQIPGGLKDVTSIDEMRTRHTEKYQATLTSLARSSQWQRKREECKRTLIQVVDELFATALLERGPVAAVKELSVIRDRFVALEVELDELNQKAIVRKGELDEEYNRASDVAQPHGFMAGVLANFTYRIKQIYLFQRFRGEKTSRELNSMAQFWARQRYEWYDRNYAIFICTDIVRFILEPVIAHVDQQKKTCEDVDGALEEWQEENKSKYQQKSQQVEEDQIDRVRPRLSEKQQITDAIRSGSLNIERRLAQMFKLAFTYLPRPGSEAMTDFKPAITSVVSDTLKVIGGSEHLIKRLLASDVQHKRLAFLEGAECMWNYTKDVTQNILTRLEAIELLGYGVDERIGSRKDDLTDSVEQLLRNQPITPDAIPTDIVDELTLIKTSHGLPVSAIRPINDLQRAYQVMNTVRAAPYLHIDYTDQVRAGYGPLGNVSLTHQEVLQIWNDEVNSFDQSDRLIGNDIKSALQTYEKALRSSQINKSGLIEVNDSNSMFFDFVDALHDVFWPPHKPPRNQTSAVQQSLMKFAQMEDILHAQGWVNIDPGYGERFKPEFHQVGDVLFDQDLEPGRIVDVVRSGYIRQDTSGQAINKKPPVRKAIVSISTNIGSDTSLEETRLLVDGGNLGQTVDKSAGGSLTTPPDNSVSGSAGRSLTPPVVKSADQSLMLPPDNSVSGSAGGSLTPLADKGVGQSGGGSGGKDAGKIAGRNVSGDAGPSIAKGADDRADWTMKDRRMEQDDDVK